MIKKIALFIGLILITAILIGCTLWSKNEVEKQSSCELKKKIGVEAYNCFGCSNGVCVAEDEKIWTPTDQQAANAKGFSCRATDQGCILQTTN